MSNPRPIDIHHNKSSPSTVANLDDFAEGIEDDLVNLAREMGMEDQGESLQVYKTLSKQIQVVSPAKYAHFHCPKTLPLPEFWPNRPLLMRESSVADPMTCEPPIPTNAKVVPFESDLFIGEVIVRLPNDPKCARYFEGKRRLNSVVISGRFKRPVPVSDLVTGQEFCHPVKNPGKILSRAILAAFKVLAPLLRVRIDQETYFLSPLAQSAQAIHVGSVPFNLTPECVVPEDTKLLGGELAEKQLNFTQRKKYFSNPKNLCKYSFDSEHYFTFDFYNDKIDLQTFELSILSRKFDIKPYLLGQPIRVIARTVNEKPGNEKQEGQKVGLPGYAWNFEIWHEKQTELLMNSS